MVLRAFQTRSVCPQGAAAFKHTVLLLSLGGESRARGGCSRRVPAVAALGPLETHTGEQWPLSPSWVTPSTAHTGHVMFLPKNLPLPNAGEDCSAGISTHQRPCLPPELLLFHSLTFSRPFHLWPPQGEGTAACAPSRPLSSL